MAKKPWLSQSSQTSEKPSHKLSFFFSASDINFRSWNKSKSRETNGMMGFRSSPEEALPHTRASASKIWCLVMVLPRPQGFHGNAMLINVAVVYKKVLDICTYVYTISYMYIYIIRYTNYKYNVQYIMLYIYTLPVCCSCTEGMATSLASAVLGLGGFTWSNLLECPMFVLQQYY